MADWKPGDAALCIKATPCPVFGPVTLVEGRTYIVRAVKTGACRTTGYVGTGLKVIGNEDFGWHNSIRFQKAPNHTPDAEDAETIALLTGAPVKEPVT